VCDVECGAAKKPCECVGESVSASGRLQGSPATEPCEWEAARVRLRSWQLRTAGTVWALLLSEGALTRRDLLMCVFFGAMSISRELFDSSGVPEASFSLSLLCRALLALCHACSYFGTPYVDTLAAVIDPLNYKENLTMSKLVIDA